MRYLKYQWDCFELKHLKFQIKNAKLKINLNSPKFKSKTVWNFEFICFLFFGNCNLNKAR